MDYVDVVFYKADGATSIDTSVTLSLRASNVSVEGVKALLTRSPLPSKPYPMIFDMVGIDEFYKIDGMLVNGTPPNSLWEQKNNIKRFFRGYGTSSSNNTRIGLNFYFMKLRYPAIEAGAGTYSAGVFTATTKQLTWSDDIWIGFYLIDANGNDFKITDNTSTTLTLDLTFSGETPVSGEYVIVPVDFGWDNDATLPDQIKKTRVSIERATFNVIAGNVEHLPYTIRVRVSGGDSPMVFAGSEGV